MYTPGLTGWMLDCEVTLGQLRTLGQVCTWPVGGRHYPMNPPTAQDLWTMCSALQCGRLKDQAAMLSSDPGGRTFKWKYPRPEEVHRPHPICPFG